MKPKLRQKNQAWYDERIRSMRNRLAKLLKKAKRKPSERNVTEFHEYQRDYKKLCEQQKKGKMRDFLENLNCIKTMSQLHKSLNQKRPPNIGCLKKKNGSYTEPGKETVDELLKTHFPTHSKRLKTNYGNKTMTRAQILSLIHI